ncbi:MAG: dethiobiotin synthase [Holophagaceae bacterium]|uniref:ATP-dependent dethiobiotin synthetase BioD n=1 Tax=Candidatus Geothrix odensensis TaxID=2954440 RepID=A0A936K7M6_9BACT|nr:dethiobiotin synthase [Candidatus Geothrix odensensis]MBK8789934.1 dethiobiotin synthase [Holophagaceae bacterium]
MLCPDALPSPLWVLGTGTGVGKTQVAARLARAWAGLGPVAYRKPFQTGVDRAEHPEADAAAVRGPGIITESHILLKAPLAPLAAAQLEGRSLDLEAAARWCQRPFEGRVLLEGVGGLLVPLAPRTHFLAWATDLKIPCVLVALGGLGTLNHTLLSAEALMLRGWRIEAVLLNPGADGTSPEVAEQNATVLRGFLPMRVEVIE